MEDDESGTLSPMGSMVDKTHYEMYKAAQHRISELEAELAKAQTSDKNLNADVPQAVLDVIAADGTREEVIQAMKDSHGGRIPSFLHQEAKGEMDVKQREREDSAVGTEKDEDDESDVDEMEKLFIDQYNRTSHANLRNGKGTITPFDANAAPNTVEFDQKSVHEEQQKEDSEQTTPPPAASFHEQLETIQAAAQEMKDLVHGIESRIAKVETKLEEMDVARRTLTGKVLCYEDTSSEIRQTIDEHGQEVKRLKAIVTALAKRVIQEKLSVNTTGRQTPPTPTVSAGKVLRPPHEVIDLTRGNQKRKRDDEETSNTSPQQPLARRSLRSERKNTWKIDEGKRAAQNAGVRTTRDMLEVDSENDAREAIKVARARRSSGN